MDEQMELLHADHLIEVSDTGRESRYIYSTQLALWKVS
jgi:hypothetical protein